MQKISTIALGASLWIAFGCQSPQTPKQNPPSANPANYTISSHQIGKARIGMLEAELKRLYPTAKDAVFMSEGELPCWDIIEPDGSTLFHATYDEKDKTVATFISDHPKVSTQEGIKIGSFFKDLKAAYPDINVYFAEGYMGNSEKSGLGFALQGDIQTEEPKDDGDGFPKVKSVSDSTVVTEIYVY